MKRKPVIPEKGWAVVDPDGDIWGGTFSFSREESVKKFLRDMKPENDCARWFWDKQRKKGYRCIPVVITTRRQP